MKALGEISWLTRVPKTLTDAIQVLAETTTDILTKVEDGYTYFKLSRRIWRVPQRWLVVYSPKAAQREEKSLARRVEEELAETQKVWRRLRRQTFNCE